MEQETAQPDPNDALETRFTKGEKKRLFSELAYLNSELAKLVAAMQGEQQGTHRVAGFIERLETAEKNIGDMAVSLQHTIKVQSWITHTTTAVLSVIFTVIVGAIATHLLK